MNTKRRTNLLKYFKRFDTFLYEFHESIPHLGNRATTSNEQDGQAGGRPEKRWCPITTLAGGIEFDPVETLAFDSPIVAETEIAKTPNQDSGSRSKITATVG